MVLPDFALVFGRRQPRFFYQPGHRGPLFLGHEPNDFDQCLCIFASR